MSAGGQVLILKRSERDAQGIAVLKETRTRLGVAHGPAVFAVLGIFLCRMGYSMS
jgi:hypothetical protein